MIPLRFEVLITVLQNVSCAIGLESRHFKRSWQLHLQRQAVQEE